MIIAGRYVGSEKDIIRTGDDGKFAYVYVKKDGVKYKCIAFVERDWITFVDVATGLKVKLGNILNFLLGYENVEFEGDKVKYFNPFEIDENGELKRKTIGSGYKYR